MQRVIGLIVLAIVLFWVIDAPTSAAGTVTAILDLLAYFAGQIVAFVRNLV